MSHEKSDVRTELMRLEFLRKRYLKGYFTSLGLTLGQGHPRILVQLLKTGGVSQRELAEACSLDVTTLSRTLDRMAELGWVKRLPSPESRRAFLIVLTEAGRNKAIEVKRGFDAEDELLWQGFSEAEMDALFSALDRIQKNLEAGRSYNPDN